MGKVRIEWRGGDGRVLGAEALDTGDEAVLSGAAPSGTTDVRMIGLVGASIVAWSEDDELEATSASGRLLTAGEDVRYRCGSGFYVSAIASAAATPSVAGSAAVITPGTPVTPGQAVMIACTVAGSVRLQLADDSVMDVPVAVGANYVEKVAVKDVVAGSTTATCVVTVLS